MTGTAYVIETKLRIPTPSIISKGSKRGLGFSEPSYRVLRRYRRPLLSNVSGSEIFELRQHGDAIPYIAMFAVNPKGKQFRDDLLMYDDHIRVAGDWTLLTSKPNVKPNELGYYERIVEHSTGYRRDGAFTVY